MSDYRRGFGLDVGFIDHFNPQLVIQFNFSANADFHTLHFTRVYSLVSHSVIRRFLVTASNSGDSSACALTSSLSTELLFHQLSSL
jgi:hypothetical protein